MRVPRDVVTVVGPDAASFLQGQLSQDVDGLAVGASAWSLVLQPQGKVEALVRITRREPDSFLFDVDGGFGGSLVERLDRFKLRVKADIEALDHWGCTRFASEGAIVVPFRWGAIATTDALSPDADPLTGDEVAAYERWRVEAGVPAMGKELTEATIPEEAGVVDVAVSFTKGCYTGQELVARIDSRGRNVPRRLRRLRGELAAGADLRDDAGKVVGTVTSAAGDVGLGYVSRQVEPPVTLGMVHVEALPPVTLD